MAKQASTKKASTKKDSAKKTGVKKSATKKTGVKKSATKKTACSKLNTEDCKIPGCSYYSGRKPPCAKNFSVVKHLFI